MILTTNREARANYRWLICALLFFATTINYLDRQILSLLKEILDREIGWTNEQFGWVNSAFQLAYAVGLLGFGWLIDRFGTKAGYAISIAAWSLAALGHGLVSSFRGFITARICLGIGEGGNFPAAIKAVALWFPKRERALATSIFNSGSNVGAIIGPAVIPWMAFRWGWQSAFIGAGILGLVWLLFWGPLYNVPEKIKSLKQNELDYIRSDVDELGTSDREKISWLSLLHYRQTWSFVIAKFLTDPVWWFFLIWLPDFFKKTYNLDIKKSWIHLVTIYAIITVFSIWGGWITGYLVKRGWTITRARKTGMLLFALCVIPVYFATNFSVWPAVLLIALAGSAHQAWSANLFTTASDMFPKQAVGSVVGLGGMAGAVGGMLLATSAGILLEWTGSYMTLFIISGSAYLVALLIMHLLVPKLETTVMNFSERTSLP